MPCGQAFRVPRLGGDAAQRHGAVGAGDREDTVGEIDIGLGRFEQVRGDRLRLLDDPVGCHQHRRAAQRRRARAAGALAERDLVGVALDVGDLVRMEAEPVAHQLLEDGLVPHALRDRAAHAASRCRRGRSGSRPPRTRPPRPARSCSRSRCRAACRGRGTRRGASRTRRDRRARAPCPCSWRTRRNHR